MASTRFPVSRGIALPRELESEIKRIAGKYSMTESSVIRMAIHSGLRAIETAMQKIDTVPIEGRRR